jgi:hypothetical protein
MWLRLDTILFLIRRKRRLIRFDSMARTAVTASGLTGIPAGHSCMTHQEFCRPEKRQSFQAGHFLRENRLTLSLSIRLNAGMERLIANNMWFVFPALRPATSPRLTTSVRCDTMPKTRAA